MSCTVHAAQYREHACTQRAYTCTHSMHSDAFCATFAVGGGSSYELSGALHHLTAAALQRRARLKETHGSASRWRIRKAKLK